MSRISNTVNNFLEEYACSQAILSECCELFNLNRDTAIKITAGFSGGMIGSYSLERNEFKDDELVCYCFGYTRKDIEKDCVDNKGRSTILERIAFEKKAGKCDCAQKNPKGR